MALAASSSLSREDAEHLAAVAAGLQSLSRGAAQQFDTGEVRQTLIEMDRGFLFVTVAGEGSCLAVIAAPGADVGLVGYEMAMIVKRMGRHMSVARRPAPATHVAGLTTDVADR